VLCGVSLLIGVASLSDFDASWLLTISRFPRTAAALLTGAGLALAGVVVQQVVQNRLVEPSLTGATESAMLGLLAVTLLMPELQVAGKMIFASLTSLVGIVGFLVIADRLPRGDPLLMPIVGMVYGAVLGALVVGISWYVDLMQFLGIWRIGEFSGVMQGRYEWLWFVALIAILLYRIADRITILGLGESHARSVGLNYNQTRVVGLVLVSILTALILVTVGAFPFVGLVAPNIVSRWRGDNLRTNLPIIAIGGGVMVLSADIIGRLVRFPFEIPAATVFAVLGAGIFLWLLNFAPGRSHG